LRPLRWIEDLARDRHAELTLNFSRFFLLHGIVFLQTSAEKILDDREATGV
jgi:hypothetical protein